ncbi:MAG: efflux RND transporter permease subunit [Deltaproteobacteria bacterium]|nr:efflux RND transporter permease subunit [Deltaproteobacteria bacterium]
MSIGALAARHRLAIKFITVALCLAGAYAAARMPSSVFPATNFPRCVVLVDNGVMPADEMMATITRPIEEAMKDIPGAVSVRSTTSRGSAEVNIFFDWQADMARSELYVNARLSQIRSQLPPSAAASLWRLTFSAFPILGVSLTSHERDLVELSDLARYELKPRFLRIPGVARVDLVGARAREYQVVIDPMRLAAAHLDLAGVVQALKVANVVLPTGMHEEEHKLFLTVVDGRLMTQREIEALPIPSGGAFPIPLGELARVEAGQEPVFNIVTADGVPAVLLNIRSQPDGSTLAIADALTAELQALRAELPPDMRLAYYYDQSLLVRTSVGSVWESILIGLILSGLVLFAFLKHWGSTLTALVVIPVTVLITVVPLKLLGMSFNLMTLGGIAAAIGLVIDDAIVVVEAIYTEIASGVPRSEAVAAAVGQILTPLVGSTLTPVVVFLPLAFLDGVTGVFFRALALTMVVALLTSLVLAVTLTPALAIMFIGDEEGRKLAEAGDTGGPVLSRIIGVYTHAVGWALRRRGVVLAACTLVVAAAIGVYHRLDSDFLPSIDEGGFIIDYVAPFGTSLAETDRQLMLAEEILRNHPDVESYSRRTGARLALAIAEPNTGDFLVKLEPSRRESTEEVISDLRRAFLEAVPGIEWEFPGILGDLIGDLTWSPSPIEVKVYSNDVATLETLGPRVAHLLEEVPGVVDVFDGLVYTGTTLSFRMRPADAVRFGLSTADVAAALGTAMLGTTASYVLEGDRVVNIRVRVDERYLERIDALKDLPLRTAGGALIKLSQVADVVREPGKLQLRREDLRQDIAVTARLEGRDLGGAMDEIRSKLAADPTIPAANIEYGGLYQQQQESLRNLLVVLAAAIFLVFTVLTVEFRSFYEPLAIVAGAVLALFGTVAGLWLTGTSFNVVSFLGAIIGVGIVAKNGILMLDTVDNLVASGLSLDEALVRSGQRRLRPVIMTSLTTLLAMLPLAWGLGTGADMLKPLAIAIMGALTFSVLLSLIATPVVYRLLRR